MPRAVCLDFDGVIHLFQGDYTTEPKGPVVPGAIEALTEYQKHFVVCVFGTRSATSSGRQGMIKFLLHNGLSLDIIEPMDGSAELHGHMIRSRLQPIRFPFTKPTAGIFIDDRSWPMWDGRFPTVQELTDFQPWWSTRKDKYNA